ncbi:MAG: LCP family protein [Clostridia bacterium]|nr:LCP family protein [Clostridia bacterium]
MADNRNRENQTGQRNQPANGRSAPTYSQRTGKSVPPRAKRPAAANGSDPRDIYISRQSASHSGAKSASKPAAKKKDNKKFKRVLISVVCVLIALVIAGTGFVYWYANDMLKEIEIDENVAEQEEEGNDFSKIFDENLTFSTMSDITNLSSYQGYILEWSENGGQKLDSKNVTNILLVGEDGDATDTTNGRSDCIMIVSIDRKNRKIVMSSIMRDSYCCYDTEDGRNYGKINGSCYYSGYRGLIETVEKFYKIDIDYYISVNFDSFPQLINAIGGVTVPIQEYEARYIRNTTVHKTVQSGEAVKLDGWEALVFCRIRHSDSDSDVSRTRRQREVIKAIIESATNATNGQLLNAIKQTAPYIKTNMSKKTMIAFGTAALKNDWVHFEMSQYTYPITYAQDKEVPDDEITGIDATVRGESCWVVDYPRSAMEMQKSIYGITNISLSAQRLSMEDLKYYAENYYEYY